MRPVCGFRATAHGHDAPCDAATLRVALRSLADDYLDAETKIASLTKEIASLKENIAKYVPEYEAIMKDRMATAKWTAKRRRCAARYRQKKRNSSGGSKEHKKRKSSDGIAQPKASADESADYEV